VLGAVPLLGDLFDAVWKANLRNVALIDRHVAAPSKAHRADRPVRRAVVRLIAGSLWSRDDRERASDSGCASSPGGTTPLMRGMIYQVRLETVPAQVTAVIRARVPQSELFARGAGLLR
jgi:hypothetical protein